MSAPASLLFALAVGLTQWGRPQLDASVDEDRVTVGDEITYTLRAASRSSTPMQVILGSAVGLEIVMRSERTEVGFDAGAVRTTVVQFRLRAARPGRWEIGPSRVVQGRDTVETAAIVVDVAPNRAVTASTLSPRLRRMLDRASPPASGEPGVDLLVSTDTVRVGEQVDVVTAAWFPRDLRLQLRRPPTLQPPVIDGVWSFPQTTPSGIAATRSVRGRWYDLFLSHQVVFPLTAGTIGIPRATLKYSTPVALQFFSQEDRFALSSRADTLVVLPLPDAGRPADFAGAIAGGLRLERRIDPATARVGEGIAVELRLSGAGNTALWPPPEIAWPGGVRAYLERTDESATTDEGRVGGTKTFRYLVVPDSAGAVAIPGVRYAYFDLDTDRYRELAVGPAAVPVAARGQAAAAEALPPALLPAAGPSVGWRLGHGLPDWMWLLLLVAPPLALALRGRRVRLPERGPAREQVSDLRSAEAALDRVVRTLAPDPDHRFGPALAAAARAAGADQALAERVTAVRERLLARRYGPGTAEDEASLAAEAQEVVRRLGGSLRGRRRGRAIGALLLLAAAGSGRAGAQSPAPERLYESGAVRAAVDGFAARASADPADAASWYNLGAAYYRLGEPGRAEAAWLRARRLAPRSITINRALELTPPADAASARWTWSAPVTPEELLLLGTLGWLAGWIGWVVRPRARERWLVLLIFAGAAVLAGLGLRAWYRQPLAVVLEPATLRLSPHGRAPAVAPVESGAAVRLIRGSTGWLLVRASGGREGWLPDAAVAAVGG
ncbi:MAG TPA: BatD family protein [Gemmatimonadales bacterium]